MIISLPYTRYKTKLQKVVLVVVFCSKQGDILLLESWPLWAEKGLLLVGCSRRSEPEKFLDILTDGHRTQYVQEYERAVSVVLTREISMAQTLNPGDGREWQFGHDSAVETGEIGIRFG